MIAKKLQATINASGKHIRAVVKHNDVIIAQFGWRHDRTKGNGNIPKDLGVSERLLVEMAKCHHDREAYLGWLRDKGELTDKPLL